MQEQAMSDDPKISNLANLIFVQGIRDHVKDAKKKGLNPREGAFYCIEKCLRQWSEFSSRDKLDFPSATVFGSISNNETERRLLIALHQERKDTTSDSIKLSENKKEETEPLDIKKDIKPFTEEDISEQLARQKRQISRELDLKLSSARVELGIKKKDSEV
jgi:hypothetical protein